MRKPDTLEPGIAISLGLIVALVSGSVTAGPEAITGDYQGLAQSPVGPATFSYLGLAGVLGGLLATVVRARGGKVWIGAAAAPIAVVGTSLTGLSPLGDPHPFLVTLLALGLVGVTTYLIIGYGRSMREGTREAARAASSNHGSREGGFGRGDRRFGGGGASGSW